MPSHLFVLPTDRLGGAERVSQMYARVLADAGSQVEVIILSRGNTGGWAAMGAGVSVYYIPSPREMAGMLIALPLILALFRRRQFDSVFSSHTHVSAWLGVLRKIGVIKCRRLVCRESTVMMDRFHGLRKWSIRMLYEIGYGVQDIVICQTDYMRCRLREFVPGSRYWPVCVVANPVDVKVVRSRAREVGEVAVFNSQYVCVVGRLIPLKGVDVLIHAFAIFIQKYPGFQLVVIGGGPELENLQSLARSLGLGGSIVFTGSLTNPMPIISGASLAVVSSRIEGFPNTLLEMMALCPRVVSTRCAGGIENIGGIFTCPPGDAVALADVMVTALKSDTQSNQQLMNAELERRSPEAFVTKINDCFATDAEVQAVI